MKKLLTIFKNVTIVTMLCLVIVGTTTISTPIVFDSDAGLSTYGIKKPNPDPDPLDNDEFD